jgi:hypothetical protein
MHSNPPKSLNTSGNSSHLADSLADGRLVGNDSETGFEEIVARTAGTHATFPTTGLLAQNNFRIPITLKHTVLHQDREKHGPIYHDPNGTKPHFRAT